MEKWMPVSLAHFDGRQVLIAGVGGAGPFRAVAKLHLDGTVYQFDPLGDGFIVETDPDGLVFQELPDFPNEFASRLIDLKHSANHRYAATK